MRDLFSMWSRTRMVVLVAVSAAIYAAVLIPFKMFVIVPGFTELRPAAAIPTVTSLLFGPAGAWGSAFGNLIGDVIGNQFGPLSFWGFVGNLLLGWMPYRIWRKLGDGVVPAFLRPSERRGDGSLWPGIAVFGLLVVAPACACAVWVAWGLLIFVWAPFEVVAVAILLNNIGFGLVLAPMLLRAVAARVEARGQVATEILDPEELAPGRFASLGLTVAIVSSVGGAALVLALGYLTGGDPGAWGDPRVLLAIPAVGALVGMALS